MLGKELRNSQNNVWLNYAVPLDQFSGAVADIIAGKKRPSCPKSPRHTKETGSTWIASAS